MPDAAPASSHRREHRAPDRRALTQARVGGATYRPAQVAREYGGDVAGDDAQVLELAGREVRITSPGKVLFGERGETKLDLVRYYAAVAEPLMRAMGGRPVLMQRFPHGRRRPVVLPEARARPTRRSGWRRPRCRPSTARRRARSSPRTSRTSRGRSTWPAWASTSGPTAPTTPSTPTSCAWTSIRSRAPASPRRGRPPGSSRRCWTSSGSPASPRRRQPRAARLRPAGAALGLLRRPLRRGGRRARARAPPARHPHRRVVEGGARPRGSSSTTTRTRRTRRCSARGRCAPARARRSRRRSRWEELDDVDPDELTLASVPGRLERDGDPWARDRRRAAVAGAAARAP